MSAPEPRAIQYTLRARGKVERSTPPTPISSQPAGSSTPAPRWAEPSVDGCATLGCERLGPRTERYVVVLRDTDDAGERHECTFDQSRWSAFTPGSRWTAEIRVLTGGIDCGSLAAVAG